MPVVQNAKSEKSILRKNTAFKVNNNQQLHIEKKPISKFHKDVSDEL
jgi:hypothetical protein